MLLLHGNPTWSFLYRNMIPEIVSAGYRVIAPDYLGSGRSDHAVHEGEYAIVHHIERTLQILDRAGVKRAVIFLQDWGGPIGLGMELVRPGLLAGAVFGSTFWGEASDFHRQIYPWRALHAPIAGPLLFTRRKVFISGCRLGLPRDMWDGPIWDGYLFPFTANNNSPGSTLAWPRAISLGPGHPTHSLAMEIWGLLATFDVPVRFVWGDDDVVFRTEAEGQTMRERVPQGLQNEITIVHHGRHFIQEWAPKTCAELLIAVAKEAFS